MDYLSVICAPYVRRTPNTAAGLLTNRYYHGTCVSAAQYKVWAHPRHRPNGYHFTRPNLCEADTLPHLSVMSFGARGELPVCDKCHQPLEDLPC